ncbi:MAG TPA: HEPN domain-containing protein [Armatimonadota bacterium]
MKRAAEELWAQARADIATATLLREAGCYYASVFFAQQAAEKSLKSASLEAFHKPQKGHNLIVIADYLQAPLEIMNCAAELNADYLAALYPEAAGGVPCRLYDQSSADIHVAAAERIMRWSKAAAFAGTTSMEEG